MYPIHASVGYLAEVQLSPFITEARHDASYLTANVVFICALLHAVLVKADDRLSEAKVYLQNAVFTKPYVCAMFVEITVDAPELSKSGFVERWFVHSFSPQLKTHRQDWIPQSRTTFNEQYYSRGEEMRLFLQNDRHVKQVSGRSVMQADMMDTSVKDPFVAITQMAYFEPMSVPVVGWSSLETRKGIRTGVLEMMLGRYVVIEEDEKDYQVIKTVRHGGSPFYDRIVFDPRLGDMPVNIKRKDGNNGKIYESIATSWEQTYEKWLPMVTEIKLQAGDTKTTWKVEYHWMLDDVPDDVFEIGARDKNDPLGIQGVVGVNGKVIRGRQLKELAVSKAIKPKKLH